jgi:WD40-like Beta Propeller Repeat
MRGRVIASVCAALCAAIWSAPAHAATFVGQNGKIAFLSSGSNCLQMVNPDGTGHTQPGACNITSLAAISPGGDRVVTPVYNGDIDAYDWRNSKLDGTDVIEAYAYSYEVPVLAWSHDGKWISGVTEYTCSGLCGVLHVALADGSGGHRVDDATPFGPVSWGTGGKMAYGVTVYIDPGGIRTSAPDGTSSGLVSQGESPDWSPGSDRVVLERNGIAVINSDGSGLHNLTTAADSGPKWSPDGQKILFTSDRDGNREIYVMNPDGTGQTNLTANPAADFNPVWSPDSKQIAFGSNRDGDYDIYVMNRDGTGLVQVTNNSIDDSLQDWQSIPINSYPRPKGATPFMTYLVPAYDACNSPNRTHGPSLAFPSCAPPTQTSDALTVGTADSNDKPTKSISSVRFDTVVGNPSTPADEADVRITAQVTDVYTQGTTLLDYAGELRASTPLRITDKLNTPSPGGPGAGTVSDIPYGFTIPCAITADPTIGGACTLSTTADALSPGAVTEGKRAIWGLGAVEVYDANDALFMTQGVFVP